MDEQDDIDLNKTKFNIVYTFADDNSFMNQFNGEEDEYEEDEETSEDEEDTDIEEIKNKCVDDVTEEEWEKVFSMEEEKMMKEEKKKKEMIDKLVAGNRILVKKPFWSKPYPGVIKKIVSRKKKKRKENILPLN